MAIPHNSWAGFRLVEQSKPTNQPFWSDCYDETKYDKQGKYD